MIQLKNLSKFYSSKGMITTGLSRINLELGKGEFVVITGESGSGKSTLLNVISGLDSYEEGDMLIDGKSTSHYMAADFEKYRKKYIGNVFQNFNLINSYTVYQNVELVLRINGYSSAEMKKMTDSIIDRVGLSEFRNTKASKLSGGQKQRVAIARALARQTDIIVADEPTGNLDSQSAEEIVKLLNEISRDRLVIVVTHNYEQFEPYASRKIKMHDGRIVENVSMRPAEIMIEKVTGRKNKQRKTGLSLASTIRLGLRNTFNIPVKFVLLLVVFTFLVTASASQYTSYVNEKTVGDAAEKNPAFNNYSKDRIVLTKEDKSLINDEDAAALAALDNVKSVELNDMLLDSMAFVESGNFSYDSYPRSLSSFQGKPDAGSLPADSSEVLLAGPDDEYLFTAGKADKIVGQKYTLVYGFDKEISVTVSGVKFTDGTEEVNQGNSVYLNDELMARMRSDTYYQISTIETNINGKVQEASEGSSFYGLIPCDKVAKGQALITADADGFYNKGGVKDKELTTTISNMYFKKKLTYKVADTYTDRSYKKKTGRSDFEDNGSAIFINPADYNSIFRTGNYQASVFIKDISMAEDTGRKLRKMGFSTMILKDAKSSDMSNVMQVIKAPVMVVMLIALLFITYFVTRIILKSRQEYYSILRMLGLARNSIRRILDVELFTIVCISFGIFAGVSRLALTQVIPIEYLANLVRYMEPRDYCILFILVEVMAMIISARFSSKLFAGTAIGTFREEE